MKKLSLYRLIFVATAAFSITGCYKLQKDYDYNAWTLDPNINMTAKQFMFLRGSAGVGADTIFKWMQMGIEYAGIDMTEYEKPGRTFIFLHNNAIRTTTGSGPTLKVTGGFFFDYPIVVRDAMGNPIPSISSPGTDSLRPPFQWTEYPQQFVKNYFLYLILQGEFSFENLGVTNTTVPTLLPPGTTASALETKLGYVVTKTTPNPDPALAASIYFDKTIGTGFDPEGKINLKLINNQNTPLNINDRTDDRSGGYFATNGKVHVYDKTIHPFRYSWQ